MFWENIRFEVKYNLLACFEWNSVSDWFSIRHQVWSGNKFPSEIQFAALLWLKICLPMKFNVLPRLEFWASISLWIFSFATIFLWISVSDWDFMLCQDLTRNSFLNKIRCLVKFECKLVSEWNSMSCYILSANKFWSEITIASNFDLKSVLELNKVLSENQCLSGIWKSVSELNLMSRQIFIANQFFSEIAFAIMFWNEIRFTTLFWL